VQPVVISFSEGQAIVSPAQVGGELVLNEEHMARLHTEQSRFEALLNSDDEAARELRDELYLEQAGTAAIVVILALGLFVHVGLYEPRILQVPTRMLALTVLTLAMLWTARLLDARFNNQELTLVPALVVAGCLAIAYARRFAVGLMAIAGLLLVVAVRADIGLFITLSVGLSMTVYLLNEIRTRTQIISSGLLTAAAIGLTAFAFGLINRQPLTYTAWSAAWAAGSAVAAALVVQGILPFIERVFRIATPLTLLEWSLADKPLLQRLAREAPGTYNHSLVLGTIAERACEAIGANGLLVRVGSLYHDVGKIHKADYFAENQQASISRHDNLSASMSLLIILGHVKDGIELAREYGLPRVLHRFIEEHHGTTVVRYFHHKASEKQPHIASGKHDREVSEAEFRYPGPKPHTKETAVLMLCDGVEGAVRSLAEPTAARIEGVVHRVIMDRLNDGQFGECDITLRELQTVEDSLVKSLCTFYHGRVSYPKAPAAKEEPRREDPGSGDQKTSAEPEGEDDTPAEQRRPA
jgi:putative nucleotidyltransferase with HDIG domain